MLNVELSCRTDWQSANRLFVRIESRAVSTWVCMYFAFVLPMPERISVCMCVCVCVYCIVVLVVVVILDFYPSAVIVKKQLLCLVWFGMGWLGWYKIKIFFTTKISNELYKKVLCMLLLLLLFLLYFFIIHFPLPFRWVLIRSYGRSSS